MDSASGDERHPDSVTRLIVAIASSSLPAEESDCRRASDQSRSSVFESIDLRGALRQSLFCWSALKTLIAIRLAKSPLPQLSGPRARHQRVGEHGSQIAEIQRRA